MQEELYANMYNIYQRFNKRKTIDGHLILKNITELKPRYLFNVDLIGPYSNSIKQ